MLDSTAVSQPAIFVASMAAVEKLRMEKGDAVIDSATAAMGLSLGEYSALCFAGAISFEDGVKVTKARGEAMQAASDLVDSSMVSVIGLDSGKVVELCAEVRRAALTSRDGLRPLTQTSACGGGRAGGQALGQGYPHREPALQRKLRGLGRERGLRCRPGNRQGAQLAARAVSLRFHARARPHPSKPEFKARMTVRLAVAGAFHTDFMAPAVEKLGAVLDEIEITKPRIPVVSNVDAKPHADPAVIRKILTAQVTAPVQWEQATSEMLENGYETGYELGPGAVVAGILKRVKKDAEIENVDVGPPKKAKK